MRAWAILSLTLLTTIGIQNQAKACHRSDMVERWYRDYLGRPADAEGLRGWVWQLQRSPVETVRAHFLSCEEYYHRRCGCNPQRYIARLYSDLLHRNPCEAEINHWSRRLSRRGGDRCRFLLREFMPMVQAELRQPRRGPQPGFDPHVSGYAPQPRPRARSGFQIILDFGR